MIPGVAVRVGVSPPTDEEEAAELGDLADALVSNKVSIPTILSVRPLTYLQYVLHSQTS